MLLPLIFLAMLGYVAWITVQGFRTGTMEAISKGLSLSAERQTQPIGFWSAAIWNLALVGLCLWGAIGSAMHP
ncbi:hypothetical protein [Sphingomonas sp. DC1200-2]|uniref:hypothetical protein n=1 Tax=Sphingomonas sp. DC1200-2 TaxID=2804598 RepID=UPI003CEF52AA